VKVARNKLLTNIQCHPHPAIIIPFWYHSTMIMDHAVPTSSCFVFIKLPDENTSCGVATVDVDSISQVRNFSQNPRRTVCHSGGFPAYRTSFSLWTQTFISYKYMAWASTAARALPHSARLRRRKSHFRPKLQRRFVPNRQQHYYVLLDLDDQGEPDD